MNQRTAIKLAIKAATLANMTGCFVDEAIRFLAAVYVLGERTQVSICTMTQLNSEVVGRLIEADYSLQH